MFKIIQSNDTYTLLDELLAIYQDEPSATNDLSLGASIFDPFMVIVPSMVLGDWLKKAVASKLGISTLLTTQFWGQYQWQLIQQVLQIDAKYNPDTALQVPEVAVLSGSVMRWRLFGFLSQTIENTLPDILKNDKNPLHFLLISLYDADKNSIPEHRLWQACDELAKVYVRYLTHRPEWLHAWTHDLPLPKSVKQMIAQKDRFGREGETTPDWLVEQYENLEKQLRFLWRMLFAEVYAYRESLEERFWAILDGKVSANITQAVKDVLPKTMYLFTVQQIPTVELMFLKRLSVHLDVVLFHLNPSKLFWADIVDKNWLATQQIIDPKMVYLKDAGHGLLSRFGKESRETFAMLADMSGGEFYYENWHETERLNQFADQHTGSVPQAWRVEWQDKFVPVQATTLLNQLKNDILMLSETGASTQLGVDLLQVLQKQHDGSQMQFDRLLERMRLPSLSIHACHSLKRQLEIARIMIARYLNELNDDGSKRQLSDVVVYLPDVDAAADLIRLVFGDGVGADGLRLPAKLTGVTNKAIDDLMQAIVGFYALLGEPTARFYKDEVFDWLLNPMLYQAFGLDFEQMNRACQLLEEAGFKRGFDAEHLTQTLDDLDLDYRYSFSYALDRLVAGLITPVSDTTPNAMFYPFAWQDRVFNEAVVPLASVTLNDQAIIEVLCQIHEGLNLVRGQYQQSNTIEYWLKDIEENIINRYFDRYKNTPELRAIFEAKNSIAASIRANRLYQSSGDFSHSNIYLSLKFVLESIVNQVSAQAVSAEPANVISFARFGALRSIPFGLTIMLDMNLSAFPRQESATRMDLMKAGLKQRGDRMVEDDDQGAFLEAILGSRDACMIFYTHIASDGVTELLPASVVSELLEFFKTSVQWQLQDLPNMALEETQLKLQLAKVMPKLIEKYLLYKHRANSFDRAIFYHQDEKSEDQQDDLAKWLYHKIEQFQAEQQRYFPPAPLWQNVRNVLDGEPSSPQNIITLPNANDLEKLNNLLQQNLTLFLSETTERQILQDFVRLPSLPTMLNVQDLWSMIAYPARHFLKSKITTIDEIEEELADEPLSFDGLQRYALQSTLIDTLALGVFDGILPEKINQLDNLLELNNIWQNSANVSSDQSAKQSHRLQSVYYENHLPAGASRFYYVSEQAKKLLDLTVKFSGNLMGQTMMSSGTQFDSNELNYSSLVHHCEEKIINLSLGEHHLSLIAKVPSAQEKQWFSIMPNKPRAGHLLKFWLHHLAWQVVRDTNMNDVANGFGVSYWQFDEGDNPAKKTKHTLVGEECLIGFKPIEGFVAKTLLKNFVLYALIVQSMPIALTVDNAFIYLENLNDENAQMDEKLYTDWLKAGFGDVIYESCSLHQTWQLILGDYPAFQAFEEASVLIKTLYQELQSAIILPNQSDEKKLSKNNK